MVVSQALPITQENHETIEKYTDYRRNIKNRAKQTVKAEKSTLRNLAKHLRNKPFKNATTDDLQSFFHPIPNRGSKDIYANHLIQFYRWLLQLKRRERPEIMDWYDYQTKREKDKHRDPNHKENNFITPTDYKKIIQTSTSLQDKALFETYYLSGARLSEVLSMTIKDITDNGEYVEITVNESKTKPRKIPLEEHPEHLLRWKENHILKDKPDNPLWINKQYTQLSPTGVHDKFKSLLKKAQIHKPFKIHSFRKTRAYIMFNNDEKRYTDKEISLFFGWSLGEMSNRREEYDLSNYDDLLDKVKQTVTRPKTYDQLQHEKDTLEKKYDKKISKLEQELKQLANYLHKELYRDGTRYPFMTQFRKFDKDTNYSHKDYYFSKEHLDYIPVDKKEQQIIDDMDNDIIEMQQGYEKQRDKEIALYLKKLHKQSPNELTTDEQDTLNKKLEIIYEIFKISPPYTKQKEKEATNYLKKLHKQSPNELTTDEQDTLEGKLGKIK